MPTNAAKTNQTDATSEHSTGDKSSTVGKSSESDLTTAPPSSSGRDSPDNQTTPDSAALATDASVANKEITPPDGVFPLDSSQDEPEKLEDEKSEVWIEVQRKKKSGKSEGRVSVWGRCF